MQNRFENPLIIQSDRTILLDVHSPRADEARSALIPFAELERSPEHLHTYRLSPLSLWNASSAGFTPQKIAAVLNEFSRYEFPSAISLWIIETAERFGKLRMRTADDETGKSDTGEEILYLITNEKNIFAELQASKIAAKYMTAVLDKTHSIFSYGKFAFSLALVNRGTVKQDLLQIGYPVKDEVPLRDGDPLEVSLREISLTGKPFILRDYQKKAAMALVGDKSAGTGFGTIVLPCGAGKTIVGMYIMAQLKTNTLILTTNISAVHQWIAELIDKTNLTADDIGEYTGECKAIKPVTVATYQVLTWRAQKDGPYPHFQLFRERAWGLIIYDELHLLPAPVFRVTAELQAVRRAGLTATLVREDGCEGFVFSLVGPKRYDIPWKDLEEQGWIADARCIEVRVDLSAEQEIEYAVAPLRQKHRIASENKSKIAVTQNLIAQHPEDKILIIGQYLTQLAEIAKLLGVPIITGKTPNSERDILYNSFRKGNIRILVVSKVANFAIDLPDASMAIQLSGTFGSRQEEAQRLGRILRPKERTAYFYTLVTRSTVEEEFAAHRQKFLAEQGYEYTIIRWEENFSQEERLW